MKSTSSQVRAAVIVSGLLVGLVGCTSLPPTAGKVIAPTAPPVCSNTGDNFQPPVVKRMVAPDFPVELRRNGATGMVLIDCIIDATGRVQNPRVIEASDESLISPALYAIWRWEFEPARRDGKPVATQATIPIRFALAE
jgi:TonB family protein